jgi:hypothetical protein
MGLTECKVSKKKKGKGRGRASKNGEEEELEDMKELLWELMNF